MVNDTVVDELDYVLSRASIELARARSLQSAKDSPAHRAAVARCRADIDALLDCYADLCRISMGDGGGSRAACISGRPAPSSPT